MDEVSFGAWLQRRRRALDMTQAELGRRVGIAAATIRKIEADERRPSAQVAEQLAEALGIPPDGRALFMRVARGELAQLGNLAAAARGSPPIPSRVSARPLAEDPLPIPLTSLIGRAALLGSVRALLARPDARLITLTGPGGVGKTRLALELATRLRGADHADFPDGVIFVPLAAVADPALVNTAIAVALGLRDRGDRPVLDQLRDALRERRMLLVLDNAEHVVAAAPQLVALLGGAPGLRLLVTSRTVLHVTGEQIVTVPPLALADQNGAELAPASQLFLARASEPGRAWQPEEIAAVAEICRRLDGLPLAIELAAARGRLLAPQELLALLGAGPFELLARGPRELPERQQTLRATLDWSFGLLPKQEQALLGGLGLFAGGFTLDLARAALGADLATIDALAALADHSLVQCVEGAPGARRFRLLEVVRLYALDRLLASGRAVALGERWAGALLSLAEQAARELRGPAQSSWLERLDAERLNLSAALAWALGEHMSASVGAELRAQLGVRLVAALIPFWWRRGYASEGQRWLAAALGLVNMRAELRAALLAQAGHLSWLQGEHALARVRAEQALDLSRSAGDTSIATLALLTLGTLHWYQGDSPAAERYLLDGMGLAEEAGDIGMQAAICLARALVAYHSGEHDRRAALLARSLHLARAADDSLGIAEALLWSGNIAVEQGALDQAEPLYREAHARYTALRDRDGEARVLHKLADLAHDCGDLTGARALFADCLAIRRALGDSAGVAEALIGQGDVLLKQGDRAGAAGCYDAALALVQARGDHVNRAWAVRGLARVARAYGEVERARQLFAESLGLAWAQSNPWGIAVCLDGLGGALAARGDLDRAAALFGAADRVRAANHLRVVPGALPDADADRAATRAQMGGAAFAAALDACGAQPLERVIAEALAQNRAAVAAP